MPDPALLLRLSRVTQKNIGLGCVLEKPEQPLIPGFNIGSDLSWKILMVIQADWNP